MNRYDRHIFICINKRELESETRKSCGKEGLALKAELSKQLFTKLKTHLLENHLNLSQS